MAGRRGHFVTSPEVGTLFATVMARALDSWWVGLGRPDPFVVVEAGAGVGTLAAGIRRAGPQCRATLRYVLVERSSALRAKQARHLTLDPPSALLRAGVDEGDGEPDPMVGKGPMFTSLAELPGEPFVGAVLANELLDNMAFFLLERARHGWSEVRVGEVKAELVEVLVPAAPHLEREADRLAPHAPPGGRIPLQRRSRLWLREVLAKVARGRVALVDYASATTASLATRPSEEWLRTYRDHGRGGRPLSAPGEQDVTCEVAVDQLATVRPPSADRSQADFLGAHGLEELVQAARATWWERAGLGDLEALRARSLIGEAEALTDPDGLGAFRVLEWDLSLTGSDGSGLG
ncbi:MAG: SAM-dependent methyltransferase [Actinomycetota bacterium]|nr:SAM-dependent methyltransferase [Actinomycetota bacterium]